MIKKKIGWVALVLLALWACRQEGDLAADRMCMDRGWYFRLEGASGGAADNGGWKKVDLPHDWSVDKYAQQLNDSVCGVFVRHSQGGLSTGYTLGGTGWYARTFDVPTGELDQLHFLYFEGAYMETDVWVNGQRIGYHPHGYTSFCCEIPARLLVTGKPNTLVVRVTNRGRNSRWYSGSGIYRHVWMMVTDKLHFKNWGSAVVTKAVAPDLAQLQLSTTVCNRYDTVQHAWLTVSVLSPQGKVVATEERMVSVGAGGEREVTVPLTVKEPQLWSTASPAMYRTVLSVHNNKGQVIGKEVVPFGIRALAFSASKGFLLNGVPTKLKGGCVHHDNGFLGAAAIDRAEVRKVELLKANGFNAVRCAHNPPSEAFLHACDTLGLLVIDEAFDQWKKPKNPDDYHRFFERYAGGDVAAMVLRDRNHPSVIMWSIGNEIQERADSAGVAIAGYLKNIVRRLDATRPVTAAVNDFWDNPQLSWKNNAQTACDVLDVCGYNYMWYEYENDHRKFPQRIVYGSESAPGETALNWDLMEKHAFLIGDFVWTALDYLGEAGIGHVLNLKEKDKNPQFMEWPWFNAWCGDIDLCGDKKPQSYYRDVVWRRLPVSMCVHPPLEKGLVEKVSYWGWADEYPSWNWAAFLNEVVTVNVYSRAPAVRLYLNGKLVEEKAVGAEKRYTASFRLKYRPGVLKAVNVVNKEEKEEVVLRTTGRPYALKLVADRCLLNASPNELAYVKVMVVDKTGNRVDDSSASLSLHAKGVGSIAGSGNASPTDMESFRSLSPRAYRGQALVIMRPEGVRGEMVLTVCSPGLQPDSIRIHVK